MNDSYILRFGVDDSEVNLITRIPKEIFSQSISRLPRPVFISGVTSREIGGVYGRYLQGYWGSREIFLFLQHKVCGCESLVSEFSPAF